MRPIVRASQHEVVGDQQLHVTRLAFRGRGEPRFYAKLPGPVPGQKRGPANRGVVPRAADQQPRAHTSPGGTGELQQQTVHAQLEIPLEIVIDDENAGEALVLTATDQPERRAVVLPVTNRRNAHVRKPRTEQGHGSTSVLGLPSFANWARAAKSFTCASAASRAHAARSRTSCTDKSTRASRPKRWNTRSDEIA